MKAIDFIPAATSLEQRNLIATVNGRFYDLACSIEALIPSSANRTAALRKMLEAKMTLVQGITHPTDVL